MNQQDVLSYLASCDDDTEIDAKGTCCANIISNAYKHTYGRDLAIASEWGKSFSGCVYIRPDQLHPWKKQLLDECEALQPPGRYRLTKAEAIGKLPSIGF